MNDLLNALKSKLNIVKQNVLVRTVLISLLAILLIFSITLAWYINNLGLWGVQFETGNIEFNAYVYDENGNMLLGPISSKDGDVSKYLNSPLITIRDAQVGSVGTVYLAVESTGSIGIQYRFAFDITGKTDKATTYLGGYKYHISKVTDRVNFAAGDDIYVGNCPRPERINEEMAVIDRNPVNGTIQDKNGYDVYRLDYTLVNKNEEYTGNAIKIYFNIFATQIGGDFESTEEKGQIYFCSTKEDIDRVKTEGYAGDVIKLSSNIVYYGDLVFNKPINLETNDFTLTVYGNLMYDYVLNNDLKIDVGGLGRVVVQCTKEGVGGNLSIKAPISDVVLSGSNAANGDIVVEKRITVDATNSVGSPGITINNVKIVDANNTRKAILVDSNTRMTVSFGTTIGVVQSVVKANNIEIVNNGTIGQVDLSNMSLLEQTNSPQIYILNNNDIDSPILLPSWSEKFVQNAQGICTGNTRIIQSISGSPMTVFGTCVFDDNDIEIEHKNVLIEQMVENNDTGLKIYYQDVDGVTTTLQSILENYFSNEVTTDCRLDEVLQLEIISIGSKAITNADIKFLNSNSMLALKSLDMQRANVCDTVTGTDNKLPDRAFAYVGKYDVLILPQNLVEIGEDALANMTIENVITIPSEVTTFGVDWFKNSAYVNFASSVPLSQAVQGVKNVSAIFVDEAYISSYSNVFSTYATRIYPTSVIDENKQHFVRNVNHDEWEITYYIRGEDSVIGSNITLDGRTLKITSIYDNAYRHNYASADVSFSENVEYLGKYNFYNNSNISHVNLVNIKNVDDYAFYTCSNLEEVVFNDSIEYIGAYAFTRCVKLNQDLMLPDTMKKIGAEAFLGTKIIKLNTGGTTSIDGRAFYNCSLLNEVVMPCVTVVGEDGENSLFNNCTSLVSVKMPALVVTNGGKMFNGCTSLREVYMETNDDKVTLGSNAFYACDSTKLKLFVPSELLAFYQSKRPGGVAASMIYPQGEKMGELLVQNFNIGQYIVSNNGDNTYTLITSNLDYVDSLVIPADFNGKKIIRIGNNAFRNQGLTNVSLEIGDNVEQIGSYAFYGCTGLKYATFGNSLETIEANAFANCSNLTGSIVLPNTMQTIASEAFRGTAITSVNTGAAYSVEYAAFYACSSLISAELPEVSIVAESGNNEVFAKCISLVSVDMPKVAKVSGAKMFTNCTSLREIYMGTKDADVTLGSSAFLNASSQLIKLYVPESLVEFYRGRNIVNAAQVFPRGIKMGDASVNGFVIGDYIVIDNNDGYSLVTSTLSFSGDVVLPDQYNGKPITEIYSNAFRNQTFTNVNLRLGDNMKVINDTAFYGLKGLLSITMDNVTTVGAQAFSGSGIKVFNGLSLTTIGNAAFKQCNSLEVANLPRLQIVDSTDVFMACTSLKSVYFEDVMSLNSTTFSDCTKLEKITINKLINSSLDNMPATMTIPSAAPCKIYVPYRSLAYYSNPWSGKPVATFDVTAKYNKDTYILALNNEGRYALIDFIPSKSLTTLTLPASISVSGVGTISIQTIKSGALSALEGTLKSITLPSTTVQLDNNAMSECNALENILVASDHLYFTSIGGVLYSKDQKMLVKYPAGRNGSFDMSTADYSLTVGIGAGAFANATKLTKIVFPASLLVIDGSAFTNCTALHTVEFTGSTPPTLMGTSIFDTSVQSFKMVIPTGSSDVVNSYLCAYNFAEYEPYIDLGGNAGPSSTAERNQVSINSNATKSVMYAVVKPSNEEKDTEEDNDNSSDENTSGGDDPNPPQGADEEIGAEATEVTDETVE